MATSQLSTAQLAAIKRRERILGNTGNRMNLVTGKDDQLQPAPEVTHSPNESSVRSQSSTSQKFYQGSPPVRILKWHIRVAMAFVLSGLLIGLIDLPWLIVQFFSCFIALESIFFTLRCLHAKGNTAIRGILEYLFVEDKYDSGIDDYMKIAIIFLGFQGAKARHFRSIVMHGMQSSADFAILSILFLLRSSFSSFRTWNV